MKTKKTKNVWVNKKTEEIDVSKMENSYLLNIQKMVVRMAKKGIKMGYASYEDDNDFMTGDIWEIYGNDVVEYFNRNHGYKNVVAEIKKRKLK